MSLKAGIDVGSTTVKLIVIDEQGKTIYSKYDITQMSKKQRYKH